MSIDLSKATALSDQYGVIKQLELGGRVIWSAKADVPIVLEVAKLTASTYASSTEYTGDKFVLLDIYPEKSNSVVKVTYGGLTKTLSFSGTNAKQVYFGTFNGVSDEVETPDSGTLTIEGGCSGFACGAYQKKALSGNKGEDAYCNCINSVIEWGGVTRIPDYGFYDCTALALTLTELPRGITSIGQYAFYGLSALALTELPSGITSIGAYAFYKCSALALTELPSGITSIGTYAFFFCSALALTSLPEGVVSIGAYAFTMGKTDKGFPNTAMEYIDFTLPTTVQSIGDYAFACSYSDTSGYVYCYFKTLTILATVPPTATENILGTGSGSYTIIVQTGCGDTYKAAEGWTFYSGRIVEAS